MKSSLARALLVVLVPVLYLSLGSAPALAALLRSQQLLQPVLTLLLLFSLSVLGLAIRHVRKQLPVPLGAMLLYILLCTALLPMWSAIEEQLHLASYVLIGVLAFFACPGQLVPAVLLGSSIGMVDELLQALLPKRIFDPRDLLANAAIATATVALLSGGKRSWWACAPLLALLATLWLLPITGAAPAQIPAPTAQTADPLALPSSSDTPQAARLSAETRSRAAKAPKSALKAPYSGASVVFITIDALRADFVPPWGQAPAALPSFEALSRTSVSFAEVLANSAWTSPGIVSFLTGLHPAVHGVEERERDLPDHLTTFIEELNRHGYSSYGFAADGDENYGGLGFTNRLNHSLSAPEMITEALNSAAGPSFVWMHLRDIHAPYDASPQDLEALGLPSSLPNAPILDRARSHYTVPREQFPGRHSWLKPAIRTLYSAELIQQDQALGQILHALQGYQNLLLVVSADHGEELLDHNGIGHASTTLKSAPHPELVRIPIYFRLPDGRAAGELRQGRFQQIDLVPTLASLLGIPAPDPLPEVKLDGWDLSSSVLDESAAATASTRSRTTLISTSPCGWQCPPERRAERIHALISGAEWLFCVPESAACDERFDPLLKEAERRASLLRRQSKTPVGRPQ